MSLRTLAVPGALLIALLIALAAPTAARAQATIDPLAQSCYVTTDTEGERIVIAARGFTPNSLVDLAFDGEIVPDGSGLQTDANGEIGVLSPLVVPAPFIPSGSARFTITLTQQDNPANVATATARHTALGVSVKPQRARPSSRIRFKGSGFTQDKPVYAHYVFGGELRKTVKMSGDPGACGQWRKRARQIPVRNPATGIWIVQFDQLKRYRKPSSSFPSVFVQLRIQVTRIFE